MEALYRKYRPSTFSDVVGQEHIERTLKNAIDQGKVSHAYLFCGPRGTGKTTTARILAKALLCKNGPTTEPDGTCEECQAIAQGTHPDVYELDAASRTGVENVREEIISRVSYAPTRGKWKVYIIDEVHMLSTAAFNALLKTIEEPPGHVVFILCTTDPQKVPETIQSRCQRFDFHRISIESIVSRLGAVCVKEGVGFEPEALELIAHRAEGGMRNALTTLEQLIAFDAGKVTLAGAQNLLGSLDDTDLSEIVEAIGRRDAVACFDWLANYVETGADLAQFVQDLAEYVRNMYLLSLAGLEVELQVSSATRKAMEGQLSLFGEDRLARMLAVLGDVSKELRTASNPRLVFEIALTRLVRPESDLTIQALAERVEELERKLAGLSSAAVPRQAVGPLSQGSVAVDAPSPQVAHSARASAPKPEPGPDPSESTPAAAATQQPAQPKAHPVSAPASSEPCAPAKAPAVTNPRVAVEPAPTPSSAQAGRVSAQGAAAMTASIDVSNPAALQRFWRSVTSTLRKVNPARGVLFMNAKIFGDPDGGGIVIQFGKDGGFAYNAAQKTEVQELLAKTIAQVAGGIVPYRLTIEGGSASTAPTSQVSTPQTGRSARSFAAPVAASAPRQPESRQQSNSAPKAPTSGSTNSWVGKPEAAFVPAEPSNAPAVPDYEPVPYDEVPLDIYGASVPSQLDDAGAYDAALPQSESTELQGSPAARLRPQVPLQAPAPASSASRPHVGGFSPSVQPRAAEQTPSAAERSFDKPGAQPGQPQPASPMPESPAAASGQAIPSAGESEADQIKSILTNSFGPGVKFEELLE